MTAEWVGADLVEKALMLAGPTIVSEFMAEMDNQGVELAQWIKSEELSGQVLQTRTGTLRRSINSHRSGPFSVDVGTNVIYGKVHEFGAVIQGRPWLKFSIGNRFVQVHSVTIPSRPFMRPSLMVNSGKIRTALATAVSRAVRRVVGS